MGVRPMVCISADRILCSPGSTSIFSEHQEARQLPTVTQWAAERGLSRTRHILKPSSPL